MRPRRLRNRVLRLRGRRDLRARLRSYFRSERQRPQVFRLHLRFELADRGANKAFCPEDVVLPAVDGRAHLHLSGYVLLDNGSRPAGLAALALAKAAGWTTSVDPQAANHIP